MKDPVCRMHPAGSVPSTAVSSSAGADLGFFFGREHQLWEILLLRIRYIPRFCLLVQIWFDYGSSRILEYSILNSGNMIPSWKKVGKFLKFAHPFRNLYGVH